MPCLISVFCTPDEIRACAESLSYQTVRFQPIIGICIFRKGDVQVNVWTGKKGLTVATILTHPKQGRNALYRKKVSNEQLYRIFKNPREHIGDGAYRTRRVKG